MFEASHAWAALQMVETHLLGPLGVKTLDPQDWAYRGDYDNADQGDDASTAHGFNYHQGPVRDHLFFVSLSLPLSLSLFLSRVFFSKVFSLRSDDHQQVFMIE